MRIILILLMSLALASCGTTPIKISDPYSYGKKKNSKRNKLAQGAADSAQCVVKVTAITDARSEDQKTSMVGGRQVEQSNLPDWILSALAFHSTDDVFYHDSTRYADISIELEIIKLYSRSISTSMASNIVLKVNLPNGSFYIRGYATGVNWASGAGEVESLYRGALSDAIERLNEKLTQESKC